MNLRALVDLVFTTIVNPKDSAEKVLGLRLKESIVLQAALLVAICSTILTYIFLQIIANYLIGEVNDQTILLNEVLSYVSSVQPIYFTANQVFQMFVFSLIITVGGKIFNGKGKFFDALLCITMVEAILILLKLLQLVLLPISALIAFLIIVPGVIWSLWAFASIAAVIHGFKSTLLTFCGGFIISVIFLIGISALY